MGQRHGSACNAHNVLSHSVIPDVQNKQISRGRRESPPPVEGGGDKRGVNVIKMALNQITPQIN